MQCRRQESGTSRKRRVRESNSSSDSDSSSSDSMCSSDSSSSDTTPMKRQKRRRRSRSSYRVSLSYARASRKRLAPGRSDSSDSDSQDEIENSSGSVLGGEDNKDESSASSGEDESNGHSRSEQGLLVTERGAMLERMRRDEENYENVVVWRDPLQPLTTSPVPLRSGMYLVNSENMTKNEVKNHLSYGGPGLQGSLNYGLGLLVCRSVQQVLIS